MRELRLSHGASTLVDDEDYERFSGWEWHATTRKRWRAGRSTEHVYAARRERKNRYLLHREIVGARSGEQVDHRNGNTLDNRKENLRVCTHAQNSANVRVIRSASGFKGVYPSGRLSKPWRACIKVAQRNIRLGNFESAEAAAIAYDKAAIHYFGEFAATNAELAYTNEKRPVGEVHPAVLTHHEDAQPTSCIVRQVCSGFKVATGIRET